MTGDIAVYVLLGFSIAVVMAFVARQTQIALQRRAIRLVREAMLDLQRE